MDDQDCRFVLLAGGVLGRTDDMMIIRGVKHFSQLRLNRSFEVFPEVLEYRLTAYKKGSMDELLVEVEDRLEKPERIINELQLRLGLRVEVKPVEIGTLPPLRIKRQEVCG